MKSIIWLVAGTSLAVTSVSSFRLNLLPHMCVNVHCPIIYGWILDTGLIMQIPEIK